MKPKEAWQNIKADMVDYADLRANMVDYADLIDNGTYSTVEDIKIIDDLVTKATPMKPIIFNAGDDFHVCPNCAVNVNRFDNNYCSHCGQKLDWSDE